MSNYIITDGDHNIDYNDFHEFTIAKKKKITTLSLNLLFVTPIIIIIIHNYNKLSDFQLTIIYIIGMVHDISVGNYVTLLNVHNGCCSRL